ncbi:MAG: S9 family peptidase [Methanotrichaceae archaeon]|nr:S9 family peptidase [Methanotrichaceae archaeon]
MHIGKFSLLFALALLIPASGADDDLIPREVLFDNPDRSAVRLSQDGEYIGYLAPLDGVLNIWISPLDDIDSARPITNDTYRGIRTYGWSYDGVHLYYLQDRDGDENWRLYSVNLSSGAIDDLTPIEGVQAQILTVSPDYPSELLVALNDKDPAYHRIYRVDLRDGSLTLIQENDEFAGFMTDRQLQIRMAVRATPEGGLEYLLPEDEGSWTVAIEIGPEDAMTTGLIGYDRAGDTLYMIDSRGRDKAALFAVDTKTGVANLLSEDELADCSGLMIHPSEMTVQAASFEYERCRWDVLDPRISADLDYLKTVADGEVEVVSRTLDDSLWIAAYVMDDGPVRYYLYNRSASKASYLFSNRMSLEEVPLAKMHSVVINARDGLPMVSYYTLPREHAGDRPDRPLPMVLLVHGGPWGRDSWGYDPLHQWLADRGYAVLTVNFRESTGFGKNFTNAGNREWGGKMQDDLVDAVNWAIAEEIADPERVAIMGGSYGGYATLAGLTMTPDLFACGVDLVGPSNLVTFMESIPPYWGPELSIFIDRVGDNSTEEGRAFLMERSPITHVGNITRPLLIAQGANDPRVNRNESEQIVSAMQERGIPVVYLLYSDEGHGFARPENRLSLYAVTEAFLARSLGGRFEPVGDAFDESTIIIPAGRELVPGLAGALASRPSSGES